MAVAAACVVLNQVFTFYKEHIRERPTPADTYATKTDHRELEVRLDTELGRERGSRKKMHEEVASLQAETKAIRAENHSQSLQLGDLKRQNESIHQRIDELPQRTIRLLNETKQLHT